MTSSNHGTARWALALALIISCGPSRSQSRLTTTTVPADAAMHMLGSVVTTLTVPEDKEPAFLAWAKSRLAEINAREKGAVVAVLTAAETPHTYTWIERGDRARTQDSAAKLQDWASASPLVMQLTDAVPAIDRHAIGDAKTITLVVTIPIKPESEQAFLDTAKDFIAVVGDKEPGTLLYSVSKHPTKPHTVVWVERYSDQATADAHAETPHFRAVMESQGPRISGDVDMQRLTQVSP